MQLFMLNSAEQEIILLINIKIPTIVSILTFIRMINTLNKISNWSLFKLIFSDQALIKLKLIFAYMCTV